MQNIEYAGEFSARIALKTHGITIQSIPRCID